MKAVVLHEYGPADNLKYEDAPDPTPGPGEVLVRMHAASLNPIDWKMRSGAAKDRFPVTFPTILGRDVAGRVVSVGEGVLGFAEGDPVFALASHTYAELVIVKASELARIPDGLELTTAGAIPLISVTGDQLIRDGAKAEHGQTIILAGALGSVGRIALHAALMLGVKVIAGVRKHQIDEAKSLGAIAAIDLSDDDSLATIGFVDAVADTIGGPTASRLITKVKPGGNYGSVVGPPANAALNPTVQVNAFMAHPDVNTYKLYAEAIITGKLILPIDRMVPLADAAKAQAAGEKGGIPGKIILMA